MCQDDGVASFSDDDDDTPATSSTGNSTNKQRN